MLNISNNGDIFFGFDTSAFVFQSIEKLNMSYDRRLTAQLNLGPFIGLKILDISNLLNRFTAGNCVFATSYIDIPDLHLPSNRQNYMRKRFLLCM